MEFTGRIEPEGIAFESWADEGQVAFYRHDDDRVAEEVVAWGIAADGSRVPLAWNPYGEAGALELLGEARERYLFESLGNIYLGIPEDVISYVQRTRPTGPSRPDKPDSRLATAFHEAAHAVTATAVGLDLNHVELNGDFIGTTDYAYAKASPQVMAVALAGEVAGCRLRGDDGPRGDTSDVLDAMELARAILTDDGYGAAVPGLRIAKLLEEAEGQARELVDVYWESITRVADALMKQASLDGDEVRMLMDAQTDF